MSDFQVGGKMGDLLYVMRRLREPNGGCPWDAKQTFSTIAPFTIEEAYEVADAIDRGDMHELRDELGDLLFQVVFHSQMAAEQGAFSFGDVVRSIIDKMIRRHPHVFGSGAVKDATEQAAEWNKHKKRERESMGDQDPSALAGVSKGIPEWMRATKLQKRAAAVGFDWPGPEPVIEKLLEEAEEVREEFRELQRTPGSNTIRERLEGELGDLLFVCANLVRHADMDVGNALRHANLKFERRFRGMEELADGDGKVLGDLSLDEQEAYWIRVKEGE